MFRRSPWQPTIVPAPDTPSAPVVEPLRPVLVTTNTDVNPELPGDVVTKYWIVVGQTTLMQKNTLHDSRKLLVFPRQKLTDVYKNEKPARLAEGFPYRYQSHRLGLSSLTTIVSTSVSYTPHDVA